MIALSLSLMVVQQTPHFIFCFWNPPEQTRRADEQADRQAETVHTYNARTVTSAEKKNRRQKTEDKSEQSRSHTVGEGGGGGGGGVLYYTSSTL
jgi:hypothetical protein